METINRFFSERGIRQSNDSVARLIDLAPLREAARLQQAEKR
jgi:hypothetical protein